MKDKLKDFWQLLKTAFKSWNDRDPFRESAIIAYYAIFSLPGLLLVIITITGYFFGRGEVSEYINAQMAETFSEETAKSVNTVVEMAYDEDQSFIATVIGIATILLGATGVFFQFQKSLNAIWGVVPDSSKSGIWTIVKARLFSLSLVITIAFLLLISLVVTAALSAIGSYVKANWPDYIMFLFHIVNFIFSLAIITLLFAMMFKILPDAKIRWHTVWTGSIITAALFVIGKSALGIYFGQANPGSGYGAAGYIILILVWTSYSSMIVFFGAEFTKAYADFRYGGIEPSNHAIKEEDAKLKEKKEEKPIESKDKKPHDIKHFTTSQRNKGKKDSLK